MGQAPTHLAQRIQFCSLPRTDSSSVMSNTPELPLQMGTSAFKSALPIMGPPPIILPVFSGMPPAASMSILMGVPIRVRRFEGLASALPVTVTTRSKTCSGHCCCYFSHHHNCLSDMSG